MTYPRTPTNAKQAHACAKELSEIHGKPWIPIYRVEPLPSRFAINFEAIEPDELPDYQAGGWDQVPPLAPPTPKKRKAR